VTHHEPSARNEKIPYVQGRRSVVKFSARIAIKNLNKMWHMFRGDRKGQTALPFAVLLAFFPLIRSAASPASGKWPADGGARRLMPC